MNTANLTITVQVTVSYGDMTKEEFAEMMAKSYSDYTQEVFKLELKGLNGELLEIREDQIDDSTIELDYIDCTDEEE